MNVYLAKFIMYFEIHRMHREGHSIFQISQHLVINRRTVSKYLAMSEPEYEHFLIRQSERKKILLAYEDFVKERLERFQDTSAVPMHDWLKEHFADFPQVSPKTVFNFVSWVRGKHNLPRTKPQRQYHPVEETPYGKQAQVDFGEYNLRCASGKRLKVFFFTLELSRSRFKYIWFTDRYFTNWPSRPMHWPLPSSGVSQMKSSMTRTRSSLSAKTKGILSLPTISGPTCAKNPLLFISSSRPILRVKEK
ncbi:MAG: hypothetical protein MI921_09790 [Cytophagales bacterium]|nr:hypothetical protein [Cytophagales bacterium]